MDKNSLPPTSASSRDERDGKRRDGEVDNNGTGAKGGAFPFDIKGTVVFGGIGDKEAKEEKLKGQDVTASLRLSSESQSRADCREPQQPGQKQQESWKDSQDAPVAFRYAAQVGSVAFAAGQVAALDRPSIARGAPEQSADT